jgi:hypothetical protein
MSTIRSVSVALVLFAGIVSTPVLAQSPWSSSPNAFGGQNFSNGGYSTPNAFGGQNFHALSGSTVTSTPNVFGGQNYSTGGHTTPNASGGWTFVGEILSSLLF